MAVAKEPRFFVDESLLGLGKVLAGARPDLLHPGHWRLPEVPVGTKDPVWIPIVAERNFVVIARDKRIRTKPAELALLRASGLRVFWIAGKKDLTNWGYLTRVMRQWLGIEAVIAIRGSGPWFYGIGDGRLTEIGLPLVSSIKSLREV